MEKLNENEVAEAKANAISLIANSQCFVVITDNGKKEKNLDTRILLNNPIAAINFLGVMKNVERAILFPQQPPPPSSIVKP